MRTFSTINVTAATSAIAPGTTRIQPMNRPTKTAAGSFASASGGKRGLDVGLVLVERLELDQLLVDGQRRGARDAEGAIVLALVLGIAASYTVG